MKLESDLGFKFLQIISIYNFRRVFLETVDSAEIRPVSSVHASLPCYCWMSSGFSGSRCEVNLADCDRVDCGTGSCIDGAGQAFCHCPLGKEGLGCTKGIWQTIKFVGFDLHSLTVYNCPSILQPFILRPPWLQYHLVGSIWLHKFATWIVGFIWKLNYHWSCDYPLANHILLYKASTNHEAPQFSCPFTSLGYLWNIQLISTLYSLVSFVKYKPVELIVSTCRIKSFYM